MVQPILFHLSDFAGSSWKLSWRALRIPSRHLEMLELDDCDEDILFFIILIFFLFINYFSYSLLLQLAQLWKDSDWDHSALETIIFSRPISRVDYVFFSFGPTLSFLHPGKNILPCFCDGLLLLLNSCPLIGSSGEVGET